MLCFTHWSFATPKDKVVITKTESFVKRTDVWCTSEDYLTCAILHMTFAATWYEISYWNKRDRPPFLTTHSLMWVAGLSVDVTHIRNCEQGVYIYFVRLESSIVTGIGSPLSDSKTYRSVSSVKYRRTCWFNGPDIYFLCESTWALRAMMRRMLFVRGAFLFPAWFFDLLSRAIFEEPQTTNG